jgi:UMP-CMP kinase
MSFREFLAALELFGCVLEEKVAIALFNDFDAEATGRINYAEFSAVLYQEDDLAPSSKGITQTTTTSREVPKRQYFETSNLLISAPSATQQPDAQQLAPTCIFVLGGPAAGKTTHCANVAKEFGFVHLSPSDLLNAERQTETSPYAAAINASVNQQNVVPAEVTAAVIRDAMAKYTAQGKLYFLIDGFPRSLQQLEGWNNVMPDVNVPFVLLLDAPAETLSERSSETPEITKARIAAFGTETTPLLDLFASEDRVRVVQTSLPPDQVYSEIRQVISTIP